MIPGTGAQRQAGHQQVPVPCLVVLVGPGAAGKSTWAAQSFPSDAIVSSDRLRAVVGTGADDLDASADAFAVLETVVRMRVGRRLTTVIDTLGLDPERRAGWLALAREHAMPCVAVAFDTSPMECRARNRARPQPIPARVLTEQLKAWAHVRSQLGNEGFDRVLTPDPVRVVSAPFSGAAEAVARQHDQPVGLRFGLHLSEFPSATGAWVAEIARTAERAGFDAIYVMDHFRQIPQVGRAWDDFLESYTTLSYVAACTERVRLGALVTGVTHRNVAHLGKIVASLDALSGGRVVCGLGLGWFAGEHAAYGWPFPSTAERYDLLQDALELLPLMWGPGSPAYEGRVLRVPEALCYPRPVQAHVPIVVGGGGEKRTLRLAAQYADVANVMGDLPTVRRKAEVLAAHCKDFERTVELSHLSTVLVGADDAQVREMVERLRPRGRPATAFAASVNAGTVADHVGRFRELAEAGVSEVVVRVTNPSGLEQMAAVISAFR